MPLYMVKSRLTDEGAKTLKENPDRPREVNEELEKMGVKVLEQYVVLGDFDFLNIIDAPDNETIAKAMLELASRGSIRTQTLPIIKMEDFLEKL